MQKMQNAMDEFDHARFTEGLFDENLQDIWIEFESEIDTLYNKVANYRKSDKFRQIVNFCTNFRHIAPFNAMLVNMQRPGSELVLTEKQWAEWYRRTLKPNAQPLIYLNMTPVGALYDISDTIATGLNPKTDQEIIDEIAHPFKSSGYFDKELLETLLDNLKYYGIAQDLTLNSSERLAAYIKKCHVPAEIEFKQYGTKGRFMWPMPYLISINKEADPLQKMQSLCHELGHFFCHHLPPENPDWWEKRRHDLHIREFEAEITAFMVCKRNGIPCPNSDKYLAHYVEENEEIPRNISVETIMKAVNAIEKMLKPQSWSEGLLYNKDPFFRERLQKERKQIERTQGRG